MPVNPNKRTKAGLVPNVRVLPKAISRALDADTKGLDSASFLNDLIDVFGGSRQMAIELHAEYQHAARGGMVRQRIMEMVQRLIMSNTINDIGKMARPSDMTKEELEDMAMRYVRRLSKAPPINTDPDMEAGDDELASSP